MIQEWVGIWVVEGQWNDLKYVYIYIYIYISSDKTTEYRNMQKHIEHKYRNIKHAEYRKSSKMVYLSLKMSKGTLI